MTNVEDHDSLHTHICAWIFVCMKQMIRTSQCRQKLQLFHLNCIIKGSREARETAPPHLIKWECHARQSATQRCVYGKPNALFIHTLSFLSLFKKMFLKVSVYMMLLTFWFCVFGFTPSMYWPVLQLPPSVPFFSCQNSPTRSWSVTLKRYNQWKSTT